MYTLYVCAKRYPRRVCTSVFFIETLFEIRESPISEEYRVCIIVYDVITIIMITCECEYLILYQHIYKLDIMSL